MIHRFLLLCALITVCVAPPSYGSQQQGGEEDGLSPLIASFQDLTVSSDLPDPWADPMAQNLLDAVVQVTDNQAAKLFLTACYEKLRTDPGHVLGILDLMYRADDQRQQDRMAQTGPDFLTVFEMAHINRLSTLAAAMGFTYHGHEEVPTQDDIQKDLLWQLIEWRPAFFFLNAAPHMWEKNHIPPLYWDPSCVSPVDGAFCENPAVTSILHGVMARVIPHVPLPAEYRESVLDTVPSIVQMLLLQDYVTLLNRGSIDGAQPVID